MNKKVPEFEVKSYADGDKHVYRITWRYRLAYLGNGRFAMYPPLDGDRVETDTPNPSSTSPP